MAKPMSLGQRAQLTRRLGVGYGAGAELTRLLEAEARVKQTRHRQAMLKLRDQIKGGVPLSEAMKRTDGYVPPLLQSMTHVGEQTGRLERTLAMMASYYEDQLKTRRAFVISIAWPMVQLAAAIVILTLVILVLGVLPNAMDVFGLGRGPIAAVNFLGLNALFFSTIFLLITALRRNWLGIHNLIPLFYLIPRIGPAIQTIALSRFCWVLSLTLDSGLDVLQSVKLALGATGSEHYTSTFPEAEAAIRRGASLAETLRATEVFPDEFLVQLEVAELSGTDAESLEAMAREYDQRAKMAIRIISGTLSACVWGLVFLLFLYFIARGLMALGGLYQEALEPI